MNDTVGFSTKEKALKGDDSDLLGTFQSWYDAAKKYRQNYDWNWYIFENYYRGNHYVAFNKTTNQIIVQPRPEGQVRLTINKVFSVCRAIRNFATSYRPKWDVVATGDESRESGKKAADTLDFYYDELQLPKKIKGAALYAIKYGIGYLMYGWDEDKTGVDNQKGEIDIWIPDPFDMYLDPAGMETGDIQNCRYFDRVLLKSVQEVTNNPNYKKIADYDISADTTLAASEFKNTLLQNQYNNFENDGELKTVLVHETWYKKSVKKKNDTETEVWVATWIHSHLLRNDKTEFEEYPVVTFSSDDNPNELIGEGYIKNIVPIVKALNRLESQVLEYNNLVNRGRFITTKDSEYNKISNETGEVIEAADPNSFRELRIGGLAPDVHAQINRFNQYIQEISGVTDSFMGNAPAGISAGIALESLKAQSANNLQDLKDNLEVAIAELGSGILKMLDLNVVAPRNITATTPKGEINTIKIIGKTNQENAKTEDATIIDGSSRVKVTIGSALAYTREGRIQRLNDMYDRKIIGPETYLKHYEFGDVEGVVDEVAKQQVNQMMLDSMAKNGVPGMPGMAQPPMPPGMPPQGQPPMPQGAPQDQGGQPQIDPQQAIAEYVQLAQDEDAAILQGEVIPPTDGAPAEHTHQHIADSQTPEFQKNDKALTVLLAHIKGEEEQQGAPTEQSINQGK